MIEADRNQRISDAICRTRSSTVALEYEAGVPPVVRRSALGVVINNAGDVLSIRSDIPADRESTSVFACDAAGHRHPAQWIAADPETGLTLLQVKADDIQPIRQAAHDPAIGSEIFLIGNPFGLGLTVSRGHIADFGRRLQIGTQKVTGLIQIQAPFHPGDNGAPLADLDGGWLGLFRGLGLAPDGQGGVRDNDIGFAIPAREALWVADQLRVSRKVNRAYLGLVFAADRPKANSGAWVQDVVPGSPAAQAGLRKRDRVVGLDDRPVGVSHDLTDRLERTTAGTDLVLDYLRDEQPHRVTVRSTSRPPADNPPPGPASTTWGGLVGTRPSPRSASPGRPETNPEEATALIQALGDRLAQLEKRVEQLERAKTSPKAARNP